MGIRRGVERSRIQSQEDQELGRPTVATTFITQTSSVTQSVDLTNKGMGNIYLRDVHDDFALHCAREDGIFDIVGVRLFLKKYGSGPPLCPSTTNEETDSGPHRVIYRLIESTRIQSHLSGVVAT